MRKIERRRSERKESALPIEWESRHREEDHAHQSEHQTKVEERPLPRPAKSGGKLDAESLMQLSASNENKISHRWRGRVWWREKRLESWKT